jgi:hypothetical protein
MLLALPAARGPGCLLRDYVSLCSREAGYHEDVFISASQLCAKPNICKCSFSIARAAKNQLRDSLNSIALAPRRGAGLLFVHDLACFSGKHSYEPCYNERSQTAQQGLIVQF